MPPKKMSKTGQQLLSYLRDQDAGIKHDPPGFLLGIDPGLSTGWAYLINGVLADFGTTRSIDDLTDWLESYFEERPLPNIIVLEKYRLFKHLALQQSGSKMEVTQAEGVVLSFARRKRIEVVEQFSDILPTAVKWSGVNLNKNHSQSHHESAYNHAYYYLVSHGMAEPKGI